jgi:hypothetical protein
VFRLPCGRPPRGHLPELLRALGGSSNGRTADSGSAYQGSNPCPPAQRMPYGRRSRHAAVTVVTVVTLSHGSFRSPRSSRFATLSKRHASRPHRLAVRTPASHVGNTGSIPVGVTPSTRICERIRRHDPLLADSEPLQIRSDDIARARLSDIKAALDRGDFDWASKLLEAHRALAAIRSGGSRGSVRGQPSEPAHPPRVTRLGSSRPGRYPGRPSMRSFSSCS